eukprot:Plantae.Rhodophyta-Hildenbrandia_rubra.ctg26490.p1 GENE.Plantae.Rhodophyta-Hildenbrandia_rubra.ctg26490~~Plantae.Rhodophyta-Hildenbrandia_rubra.ctg26490.p1  ORF type:complete len:341 (-),score=8.90 Plantae.Rhodophyta-Hildenbrandia_rubra.ctg26490:892-1878(-)
MPIQSGGSVSNEATPPLSGSCSPAASYDGSIRQEQALPIVNQSQQNRQRYSHQPTSGLRGARCPQSSPAGEPSRHARMAICWICSGPHCAQHCPSADPPIRERFLALKKQTQTQPSSGPAGSVIRPPAQPHPLTREAHPSILNASPRNPSQGLMAATEEANPMPPAPQAPEAPVEALDLTTSNAPVVIMKSSHYRMTSLLGANPSRLVSAESALDAGSGHDVVKASSLPKDWEKSSAQSAFMPALKDANNNIMHIRALTRIYAQLGGLTICAALIVCDDLAAPALIGASFIDRHAPQILTGRKARIFTKDGSETPIFTGSGQMPLNSI